MADQAGLTTFVGRVRGNLASEDAEWIETTSAAVESLRSDLVTASERLGALERQLGEVDTPGAGAPAPTPTWDDVVVWAATVNAALVEMAARRRLPASVDVTATAAIAAEQAANIVSDRTVELGRLLQSIRGEQVIDDLLTAGILVAPPGTTGTIAFEDHGAWDIEFLGSSGHTIARADIAITSDPSEILDHLATRPGVDLVYTTSDAADGLVGADGVTVVRPGDAWPAGVDTPVVVDVGTDTTALHADLAEVLDGAGAGGTADALLEAVPVLALLVVGSRAAARAATTADAGSDIATATWQQTKDVITTAGVSELVGWASGMNLIKVPATLTFALSRAAVRDARSSVELSGRRVTRARRLVTGVRDD
jgi:hypothetical protein